MRKAVYIRFVIVIFATALFSGIVSAVFSAVDEENKVRDRTAQLCEIALYEYETHKSAGEISAVLGGERVTVISPDGSIAEDSETDAASMENHLGRPEVQKANTGNVTTDSRISGTLGSPFMYAAIKTQDGNILRVAHRYGGIWSNLYNQLPVFLITFFVCAVIMLFVANALTKRIVRPLEEFTDRISGGDYKEMPVNTGYYEIDRITMKIKDLLNEIGKTKSEVELQQEKTAHILSNINEGFILLDDEKNIVTINNSACEIFGVSEDVLGSNIYRLVRNRRIEEAVDAAVAGTASSFDYKTDYTIYSVHVSTVRGEYVSSDKNGVVILFVDVGAERISQAQRSEFFTNASHELKTPITTLMGLSEMLESGMLDNEKKQQVYGRIHRETVRISTLINDILTISRLEANMTQEQKAEVNLAEIAREVAGSYEAQAAEAEVKLSVKAEDVIVMANRTKLWDLLNNLVDNAIKYNKPNGTVDVNVSSINHSAIIKVKDSGIGIEREEQNRIFERFYRVDTNSGKIIKGTGLGLSIVKHVVNSLGGTIFLTSEIGRGTEITVRLPLE